LFGRWGLGSQIHFECIGLFFVLCRSGIRKCPHAALGQTATLRKPRAPQDRVAYRNATRPPFNQHVTVIAASPNAIPPFPTSGFWAPSPSEAAPIANFVAFPLRYAVPPSRAVACATPWLGRAGAQRWRRATTRPRPGASTKDAELKKSPGIFLHSRTVRDGEPIVAILAGSPVID
jgi:hypothetical protein